jgi:hypothetical protein
VDTKNVVFYNPGRLRESTAEAYGGREDDQNIGHSETFARQMAQRDTFVDGQKDLAHLTPDSPFVKTTGWAALPRSAAKEIESGLKPSGAAGRVIGKVQGLNAAAILGLSPSFLVMNTLAHVVLATFGTRGRILTDAAKFPLWWHGLSDAEKDRIDSLAGGRVHTTIPKLGSQAGSRLSEIRDGWQKVQQSGIGRVLHVVNPAHALLTAEDMQSNFFRRMVYYNATKREAINNMGRNMKFGVSAMNRLQETLHLKPSTGVDAEMRRIIASQADAERLGRYVVDAMGDYARFTRNERTFLNNRAVLFYSFLRHATRTLLYVLPIKHPIATALVGEMGKLHNDEVKKMLGGQDLPWAYSRVFFNKNGKLTSIDMLRASPVGSIVQDASTQGMRGLSSLMMPELQGIMDMMYKQTNTGTPVKQNAFTLLNDYLSMTYPYRLAKDFAFGTRQQESDSVPLIHPDAATRKTAAAQAYMQAKEQANGPEFDKVMSGLLGLWPKPDDSKVIAQHMAKKGSTLGGGKLGGGTLGGGTLGGGTLG